jgi:small GTP-binding protein
MATNLTPQYHEAEEEYKKAETPEDKLACLKKMFQLVPKHKASEKLQADLKTKMSELKDEIEHAKKHPKKAGVSYKFPKQGAGQYVIVGAPNVGKSRLLTRLTRATPEVAAYPFTTREPYAGMMDWQDVKVQLIDTPPITPDFMEPYVSSIVRAADAAILMLDLGDDDGPFDAETVLDRLAQVKTMLVGARPATQEDYSIQYVRTLLIANKIDADGATDRLDIVKEMFAESPGAAVPGERKFPIHIISAEHGTGLEELRDAIYGVLNVIRVYTKHPGKPADMTSPFTCPIGSTVVEMAGLVHRDFTESLKSARIWGTGVHDGQTVGRDHVLSDKDVVELHT